MYSSTIFNGLKFFIDQIDVIGFNCSRKKEQNNCYLLGSAMYFSLFLTGALVCLSLINKKIYKNKIEKFLNDHTVQNFVVQDTNGHHWGLLQKLVRGTDPNSLNEEGNSLLMMATSRNLSTRNIEILRTHGADFSLTNPQGETVFHMACKKGSEAVIRYYLENYPQGINEPDMEGNTPLHHLLRCERVDAALVRMLVEIGADLKRSNLKGELPLHLAPNFEIFQILLDAGANPGELNEDGFSPAHLMLSKLARSLPANKEQVMDFLRSFDLNRPSSRESGAKTLLHMALELEQTEKIPLLVEALVEAGADASVKDEEGRTPLEIAAKKGEYPLMVDLVKNIANPGGVEIDDLTLLEWAIFEGYEPLITALYEKGVFLVRIDELKLQKHYVKMVLQVLEKLSKEIVIIKFDEIEGIKKAGRLFIEDGNPAHFDETLNGQIFKTNIESGIKRLVFIHERRKRNQHAPLIEHLYPDLSSVVGKLQWVVSTLPQSLQEKLNPRKIPSAFEDAFELFSLKENLSLNDCSWTVSLFKNIHLARENQVPPAMEPPRELDEDDHDLVLNFNPDQRIEDPAHVLRLRRQVIRRQVN